jgi:16S rRNA G966 N2-methylase RsmD
MKQITIRPTKSLLRSLRNLQSVSSLTALRKRARSLNRRLSHSARGQNSVIRGDFIETTKAFLTSELEQIERSQTLERAHYYIARLHKSLTSVKTAQVNDLNLRRWKQYGDILTDSLWVLPRRDSSGNHAAWYWGNFIPQIPHQLMMRYTKKGEWVLDPFAGSGTTLIECRRLERNGLGIELNPSVARKTQLLLKDPRRASSVRTQLVVGDSTKLDFRKLLRDNGAESVQLVILHPPYHDIIRFSRRRSDLSNASTVRQFTELFGKVVDNSLSVLQSKRFLALVIGDKYTKKEWVPLGFLLMEEVLKRDCLLKSIVVKNFEQTAGKRKQHALWRYRALVGGFYVFKHEYIFIFQKR